MPSLSRVRLVGQITKRLRELPYNKLKRAYDFLFFLAGVQTPAQPGGAQPAEQQPVEQQPTKTQPGEEQPTDDKFLDVSFAWMMRAFFGPTEFPEDDEPLAARPRYERLKGVPLRGQEQSLWCWASTAQMIMAYHGEKVSQLELAKSVARPRPGVQGDPRFNRGGWPPFDNRWGFKARVLSGGKTLSAKKVQAEIDAKRPFAISWKYPDGGGHMLVITGYLWIGDELWLVAHDPLPPSKRGAGSKGPAGGGDKSLISYDHYVKGLAGTWKTYYNIRPVSSRKGAG